MCGPGRGVGFVLGGMPAAARPWLWGCGGGCVVVVWETAGAVVGLLCCVVRWGWGGAGVLVPLGCLCEWPGGWGWHAVGFWGGTRLCVVCVWLSLGLWLSAVVVGAVVWGVVWAGWL